MESGIFKRFGDELPEDGVLVLWFAIEPARGEAVPPTYLDDGKDVLDESTDDAWVYHGVGYRVVRGLSQSFMTVHNERLDDFTTQIMLESGVWVYLRDLAMIAPLDRRTWNVIERSKAEVFTKEETIEV